MTHSWAGHTEHLQKEGMGDDAQTQDTSALLLHDVLLLICLML